MALAEEYRMGGTCVIRGCIPKKLFVYASHFSEDFQDATGYGWTVGEAKFDWPTLIANKDKEIARLEGIYRKNVESAGVKIFGDRAVFEDPHTLLLLNEGRRITADKILIATGNSPTREMGTSHVVPGGDFCITSNEAFHLDKLPGRILVAGGGYVALEFAHIFHGLGSKVSLVYRGEKPLRGFDEDLRDALMESMKRRDLNVLLGCEFTKVEKRGNCLHAETNKGGMVECDEIMLAIGRMPNTADLHVEKAGVTLGKRGEVVVDEYSKTSAGNIYAIGDVTDRIQLTPVAIHEAMCFVKTAFEDNPTSPDHEHVPSAVFHDAGDRHGRNERDQGARHGPCDRRLQIDLPAAQAHHDGQRGALAVQAGRRPEDTGSPRLPHLRLGRGGDHPDGGGRDEDGREEIRFRRNHRTTPDRGGRTGDNADEVVFEATLTTNNGQA